MSDGFIRYRALLSFLISFFSFFFLSSYDAFAFVCIGSSFHFILLMHACRQSKNSSLSKYGFSSLGEFCAVCVFKHTRTHSQREKKSVHTIMSILRKWACATLLQSNMFEQEWINVLTNRNTELTRNNMNESTFFSLSLARSFHFLFPWYCSHWCRGFEKPCGPSSHHHSVWNSESHNTRSTRRSGKKQQQQQTKLIKFS